MKNLIIAIVILLVSISFSSGKCMDKQDEICNESLLSNKGKMTLNTLIPNYGDKNSLYFDGEVELTGVLEKRLVINRPDGGYYEFRFYPDNNLTLPYSSKPHLLGTKIENPDNKDYDWDYTKAKRKDFNERLESGVLIRSGHLLLVDFELPSEMQREIFGAIAVRAKVTLDYYQILAYNDYKLAAASVERLSVERLTTDDFTKTYDFVKTYYYKAGDGDKDMKMLYNSQDSYVNLRKSPNGEIITQIQAKDMKGFFQKAYIYYMGWHDGWYEVYYLPPNALDGKDAIYGYIHNSQIKKRTQ